MYKEVAVDPACMADDACFFALREQFGFEKGRYLIADGRRWLHDAMVAVKGAQSRHELKPVRAKTIKEWINKSGRKVAPKDRQLLLPSDRLLTPEMITWNDWWQGQQAIRSFDVSVMLTSDPPQVFDFTQLSEAPGWQVPPSYSVDRTAISIVAALEPLLRISKEIWLVDNYFNLGSNKVLVELIRTANQTGCTHLKIVTACDCASVENVWNKEYRSLITGELKCRWLKIPDKYFHDRYLISDVGAIKAGHGFSAEVSKGTAADKLNLGYCAFDEALSIRQQVETLIDDGRACQIWSN